MTSNNKEVWIIDNSENTLRDYNLLTDKGLKIRSFESSYSYLKYAKDCQVRPCFSIVNFDLSEFYNEDSCILDLLSFVDTTHGLIVRSDNFCKELKQELSNLNINCEYIHGRVTTDTIESSIGKMERGVGISRLAV